MSTKNIAILYGGDSREAEISRRSAANVCGWMNRDRYRIFMTEIRGKCWQCSYDGNTADIDKNDFTLNIGGERVVFDAALIMIHGAPGENGVLQSYFDLLRIPYTTCSAFVSALTFNKFACKAYLAAAAGILSAKAAIVRQTDPASVDAEAMAKQFGLPLFVKPNNDGSSFGVSKVKQVAELMPAIAKIAEQSHDDVIVEEFIGGREITVGAMRLGGKLVVLPVTEIVSSNDFFDYEAKYTAGRSQEITPAQLDGGLYEEAQRLTLQIYETLQCAGIVRVDYIVREGKLYFLEINTVPGMSEASIIPQQALCAGLDMTQVLSDLVETAIASARK